MAAAMLAVIIRAVAIMAAALLAVAPPTVVSGQAAGACTKSLLTSFTPCLTFISNGTNGAAGSWSPPSAACCTGLAAVVNVSTSCAQLILAGQAAVGVQVNCALAVALPKACNATVSVSLNCTNTPTAAVSVAAPSPSPTRTPINAPARSSAWRRGGGGRVAVLPALTVMLGVGAMLA